MLSFGNPIIPRQLLRNRIADFVLLESFAQPVKPQINDRSGVEREHLTENQTTDDGDAERTPQLRARPGSQRQRQPTEQRRHGRHHDGTETQQTGLKDRLFGWFVLLALSFESEVDHHDGVFLHDADQQNDADQRDHRQIVVRDLQRQDRAYARRRQCRENRDGMNVALIQNSQHNVHRDDGGQNQKRLARQRVLECGGRSLK